MPLAKRVTKPTDEARPRLKLLTSGATGVGKTTSSIWPNGYLIDGEHGSDHYDNLLAERNCGRKHITDTDELYRELQLLMTERHDYQHLIIDPITVFYEDGQAKWTDRYARFHSEKGKRDDLVRASMQDFGPGYWAKVKREQRGVINVIKKIDMNVIVTAHEKPMYAPGGGFQVVGQTYDGVKGLDYLFDTVLRLVLVGDKRVAYTQKDRTHKFPAQFDYDFDTIRKLWGDSLTQASEPIVLATPEQVARIVTLLGVVTASEAKSNEEWADDCLRRAEASEWSEVEEAKVVKVIKFLEARPTTQGEPPCQTTN